MIKFCKDYWAGLVIGSVCAAALIWGVAYWMNDSPLVTPVELEVTEQQINHNASW